MVLQVLMGPANMKFLYKSYDTIMYYIPVIYVTGKCYTRSINTIVLVEPEIANMIKKALGHVCSFNKKHIFHILLFFTYHYYLYLKIFLFFIMWTFDVALIGRRYLGTTELVLIGQV